MSQYGMGSKAYSTNTDTQNSLIYNIVKDQLDSWVATDGNLTS